MSSSKTSNPSLGQPGSLVDCFTALPPDAGDGDMVGNELADREDWHVARDACGNAVLLVPSSSSSHPQLSVSLPNLSIVHSRRCSINSSSESSRTGRFSLVTCLEPSSPVVDVFFRVIASTLSPLPARPTGGELAESFSRLVELFRTATAGGSRSASGLWAEMFLIAESADPRELLRAWHSDTDERYDFSRGWSCIEVKSTQGSGRRHVVSHEQTSPVQGESVVFASIRLRRAVGGLSLRDLWGSLAAHASGDPELTTRLDSVFLASLGRDYRSLQSTAFSIEFARQSLEFFDASSVPRITGVPPKGVTSVKFSSDFSLAKPLSLQEVRERGGLFGCL